MIWRKNNMNSKSYDEILEQFKLVSAKLSNLEADFQKLDNKVNSLRGLVNRKLGYSEDEEQNINKSQWAF